MNQGRRQIKRLSESLANFLLFLKKLKNINILKFLKMEQTFLSHLNYLDLTITKYRIAYESQKN